jgi:hypothetical protein
MRYRREDVSIWARQLQQGQSEGGRHLADHRWSQRYRRRRYASREPSDAEKVVTICLVVTALYTRTL